MKVYSIELQSKIHLPMFGFDEGYEIEQHITIYENGSGVFDGYVFDAESDAQLKLSRSVPFQLSALEIKNLFFMIENNPYFNYIKPIVSGQATWDLYITDTHDSVIHYTGILSDFEQRVFARYFRKCIKVENLLLFGDNVPEVKSVALSMFDKDDYHEYISIGNQQLSIEVQKGSNRSMHQFY